MISFNLPGPLRVGLGRNGKMYGSVNMGPVSVSGALNQPHTSTQPGVWPISMEEAVRQVEHIGFRVHLILDDEWVIVRNGWTQVRLIQTPQGITFQQETHPAKLWTLLIVGGLLFALCAWASS